jgi:hypothetical protein
VTAPGKAAVIGQGLGETILMPARNENLVLREEIDRSSMFEEIVGSCKAIRQEINRSSTDSAEPKHFCLLPFAF